MPIRGRSSCNARRRVREPDCPSARQGTGTSLKPEHSGRLGITDAETSGWCPTGSTANCARDQSTRRCFREARPAGYAKVPIQLMTELPRRIKDETRIKTREPCRRGSSLGRTPQLTREFENQIGPHCRVGGQPLGRSPIRSSMESKFGHDFSRVHIAYRSNGRGACRIDPMPGLLRLGRTSFSEELASMRRRAKRASG